MSSCSTNRTLLGRFDTQIHAGGGKDGSKTGNKQMVERQQKLHYFDAPDFRTASSDRKRLIRAAPEGSGCLRALARARDCSVKVGLCVVSFGCCDLPTRWICCVSDRSICSVLEFKLFSLCRNAERSAGEAFLGGLKVGKQKIFRSQLFDGLFQNLKSFSSISSCLIETSVNVSPTRVQSRFWEQNPEVL